jgi:hypothetical protein
MFLQQRLYLLDGLRVLLQKDLIGDVCREHVAGMFQAEAGRATRQPVVSTRNAISDTFASYAISEEQGTRKNGQPAMNRSKQRR